MLARIEAFKGRGGCVLLVYAALLSRGVDQVTPQNKSLKPNRKTIQTEIQTETKLAEKRSPTKHLVQMMEQVKADIMSDMGEPPLIVGKPPNHTSLEGHKC